MNRLAAAIAAIGLVCLGSCRQPMPDLSHCVDAANQKVFDAQQSSDACFVRASTLLADSIEECDAGVPNHLNSQCVRVAISIFRENRERCEEEEKQKIREAIAELRQCVRQAAGLAPTEEGTGSE